MLKLLASLAVLAFASGCYAGPVDYPWFVDADAWCDTESPDWFDLWAEVDHDEGPRAVQSVWVDVSFVEYDGNNDMLLTYGATYDLAYQAEGQWAAAVESGTSLLDCDYEFEYYFLFTAEDAEGQTTQTDLIN